MEIKILLMRGGHTPISALARKYAQKIGGQHNLESLRKQFSMCINGEREYPHLQQFIADTVDKPVEQLFGKRSRKAA